LFRRYSVALALFLCGCAAQALTENDCRVSNWYSRGEQEGLTGLQPQIDLYAQQCATFGLKPDPGQYMSGWQTGNAEWTHRMATYGRM
jgi:Protein of unknown function (DUF2799)